MRDDLLIEQLKEAMERQSQRPAAERFRDMIRRGVIDEHGNVLIRMPEPPAADNGEAEGGTAKQAAPTESVKRKRRKPPKGSKKP